MRGLLSRGGHFAVKHNLDDRAVRLIQFCFHIIGKTRKTVSIGGYNVEYSIETSEEIRLFLPEVTERPVVERFVKDISGGDVIWDVGANVGLYSLLAAEKGASVVAVEPHPTNLSRLKENATRNGHTLEYIDIALGASEGEVTMPLGSGEAGENFGTDDTWEQRDDHIVVQRRAARDIIAEGVNPPTVLKIDVEGGELAVLEGLLPECCPRVIYCEVHGFAHDQDGEEIEKILINHGYSVAEIYDDFREDNYTLRAERE